jgi:hypothetical protein
MGLRSTSDAVTAELGALEIAAVPLPAGYQPEPQLAPQITVGPYLHTVRAIGSSPADTPNEIITSTTKLRTEIDEDLIKIEGSGALTPADARVRMGTRYPLLGDVGGAQPVHIGSQCWRTGVPDPYTEFLLPAHGVLIRASGEAAQVVVRRFSPPLGGVVLGSVAPHQAAVVRFPADTSGRPWFVRVSGASPIEVCGVG